MRKSEGQAALQSLVAEELMYPLPLLNSFGLKKPCRVLWVSGFRLRFHYAIWTCTEISFSLLPSGVICPSYRRTYKDGHLKHVRVCNHNTTRSFVCASRFPTFIQFRSVNPLLPGVWTLGYRGPPRGHFFLVPRNTFRSRFRCTCFLKTGYNLVLFIVLGSLSLGADRLSLTVFLLQ